MACVLWTRRREGVTAGTLSPPAPKLRRDRNRSRTAGPSRTTSSAAGLSHGFCGTRLMEMDLESLVSNLEGG